MSNFMSCPSIGDTYYEEDTKVIGEFIPTSGIVGLWHLNGNSTDSSGNGNNGTDTNVTYSLANGKFGQGAGFNGTTSKIVLANTAALRPTSAFTIMAWAKVLSSVNNTVFANAVWNSGDYSGYQVFINNYKAGFSILPQNGTPTSKDQIGSTTLSNGIYHFICGVYNGTNMYLYVNGVSDATPLATTPPQYDTPTYPTIGANYGGGGYGGFMNGAIDEVAFFPRALSASEIRKWFSFCKGRYL